MPLDVIRKLAGQQLTRVKIIHRAMPAHGLAQTSCTMRAPKLAPDFHGDDASSSCLETVPVMGTSGRAQKSSMRAVRMDVQRVADARARCRRRRRKVVGGTTSPDRRILLYIYCK